MSTPIVSVVMPCYNYARYLGDCVRSVLDQRDAPPFEIVAVDDGSTDGTLDVLHGFRDERIRVVRHPRNLGHVATINHALPLTRGSIVTRIDPDDRYRPHFLATVTARLAAHPEAGLVYGRAAVIDEAGRITAQTTAEPHQGDFVGSDLMALLERNFICAPTVAARRQAWIEALPVPEGLAFHDWFFTVLIARRHRFCFVDDILADYRVHGANHHTTIAKNRTEERSVLYLLDRVFAEPEATDDMELRKQRARARIYGSHYLDFANKYFGHGMNADARRCYLAAIRRRTTLALDPGVARRLAATMIGRRLYEGLKTAWANPR